MRNWPHIHPGDSVSDAHVQYIYAGLRAANLPKPEWTHGAHLCAGIAILADRGLSQAEAIMPDLIRRYNDACGVINSDSEGYHHTLTLFYLRTLDQHITGRYSEPLGALATEVLASPIADRAYPLERYSRAHLFSTQARRHWVDGDL